MLAGVSLRMIALATVSALTVASSALADGVQPAPSAATDSKIIAYGGSLDPYFIRIHPFYGSLHPFIGDPQTYYGDANTYVNDLIAFYMQGAQSSDPAGTGALVQGGNLISSSVTVKAASKTTPAQSIVTKTVITEKSVSDFWSHFNYAVRTFTTNTSPTATAAGVAPPAVDPVKLQSDFSALLSDIASRWAKVTPGDVSANKQIESNFAAKLLAKYHIDPTDAASLAAVDSSTRNQFLVDWYDSLMARSGLSVTDYWMRVANWTPNITRIEGSGLKTVVGILDFAPYAKSDPRLSGINWGGFDALPQFAHGTAVADLIVQAPAPGKVMGVAPGAIAIGYNPFDSSGSTDWGNVSKGIVSLAGQGASVINMSLGVPGSTFDGGWAAVFKQADVAAVSKSTVFVIAAGNDGVTQSGKVAWDLKTAPAIIVVGSVGADGEVSNFSNRPGETCLTVATKCNEYDKLKYRFIVAPGENLLTTGNDGGVTRQSGTSFAAPLVTGAVALLQTRWPWLAQYPQETASIILGSASYKGDTGNYGRGILNIAASQSPLNWEKVTFYAVTDASVAAAASSGASGPLGTKMSVSDVISTVTAADKSSWTANGLYFSVFEKVGNTFRDFQIPLSSKLVGQNVGTDAGQQLFQSFITSRLVGWAKWKAEHPPTTFANAADPDLDLMDGHALDFTSTSVPIGQVAGLEARVKLAPAKVEPGYRQGNVLVRSEVALTGNGQTVRFGFGDGAESLASQAGLGVGRDFDISRGGLNPLLGLASGGGFFDWRVAVSRRFAISAGVTQRRDQRDYSEIGVRTPWSATGAGVYEAAAEHVGMDMQLAPTLVVRAGLTRLNETSGLLGVQSMDPTDFAGGSTTLGRTLGFDVVLPGDLLVSGSGLWANTRSDRTGQSLTTDRNGLDSASFEFAVSRAGLFNDADQARLSLSQPLHTLSGKLDYTGVQVGDRRSGALTVVHQQVEVGNKSTPFSAEFLYSTPVFKRTVELGLYGRVESGIASSSPTATYYIAGGKISMAF